MALRCLVFSSNEATIQPIWQVLADLGVQGEHCASAVDAVERVTTQMFQIVITDWDDQPEAAFLLKTAKDLKAANRPLTLAIVGDESKLPEALQAGANSVLVKPIRADHARDTMSTACELLRAKHPAVTAPVDSSSPHSSAASAVSSFPVPKVSAPAFSASSWSGRASGGAAAAAGKVAPASVTQAPESSFRAGEFLQPNSAPGAQFSTEERAAEGDKSEEQAGADEVEALTELEPMAASVAEGAAQNDAAEAPVETKLPLTGWAALQARLVKTAPAPAKEVQAKSELLSYGDTPSFGSAEPSQEAEKQAETVQPKPETKSEADLFAYMEGQSAESQAPVERNSRRGRIIFPGILAAACVLVAAVPRARQGAERAAQIAARAGMKWLNPPPVAVPQAEPQHDSFGQAGDEYKLPAVGTIPDATTDASQIRVVPVVDPTAKPNKNADANNGPAQPSAGESNAGEQNPPAANPGDPAATDTNGTASPEEPKQEGNPQKDVAAPVVVERTPNPVAPAVRPPVAQAEMQSAPPVQRPASPHTVTVASNAGIPSSLRTQMASPTPEASGNKPPEAAMSSIEPVPLKESALRDLLVQPAEPEYPASAKASGQRGSVVLQVIVGRDGAVQDAKFLQGSLVFARAAIEAVKQWRFKPYSMNGRPASMQGVVTLNFKPPA